MEAKVKLTGPTTLRRSKAWGANRLDTLIVHAKTTLGVGEVNFRCRKQKDPISIPLWEYVRKKLIVRN